MIADPERRGRDVARLYAQLAPRLFGDLADAGLLPGSEPDAERVRARQEWECFALYACVRGLIAGGGFNRETAQAIDALHDAALAGWSETDRGETLEARRRLIAERYAEYGAIGQAGGRSGAHSVTARLGEAAARRMTASESPAPELAEMVGTLHESLAEGITEAVRNGGQS